MSADKMPGLPTELYLDILDLFVAPAYRLSAPQPAEVIAMLRSLCATSHTLYDIAAPYLYNCVSLTTPEQLRLLLLHGLAKPRQVRTFIYNGAIRTFPAADWSGLIQMVSPTLERLILNFTLRMPLSIAYNNPMIDVREAVCHATNLVEFASFSTASDELIFPSTRRGKEPSPVYAWPSLRRVVLLSLFIGGSLEFATVLPGLESIAVPCQAIDESGTSRLERTFTSWQRRVKFMWVCDTDEPEEGNANVWFLFNFLPVADGIARRHRAKVDMVCVHAPVNRMALGRWMQEKVVDGSLWEMDGHVLGTGTALGKD